MKTPEGAPESLGLDDKIARREEMQSEVRHDQQDARHGQRIPVLAKGHWPESACHNQGHYEGGQPRKCLAAKDGDTVHERPVRDGLNPTWHGCFTSGGRLRTPLPKCSQYFP